MKFVSLFASALAVTALVSGCGIVKKSGVTASDSNSTVKTTPVISNISSYDEAQIAPLLGSWAVTAINGQKSSSTVTTIPRLPSKLSLTQKQP